jgi:hypothetical protein
LSFFALLADSFLFIVNITFRIPLEVSALLPAAYRGHYRMAQVVLAMGGTLNVRPFELGAAATRT